MTKNALALAQDPAFDEAVEVRAVLNSAANALALAAGPRRALGAAVVDAGLASPEQLASALAEQRQSDSREKLGEILLRMKLLSRDELGVFLAFQRHQSGELPTSNDLRLGEILLRIGAISRDALNQTLESQRVTREFLGAELIKAGHVTPAQVEHGLGLQKKLVTAALVAALSTVLLAAPEEAEAGNTAAVTVSAVVTPNARMEVVSQASQIEVTAEDVRRGYVDARHASALSVVTNSHGSYEMEFFTRAELFTSVRITGFKGEVQLDSGGGSVVQTDWTPAARDVRLSYRFYLAPGTAQGVYPWPLAQRVRGI